MHLAISHHFLAAQRLLFCDHFLSKYKMLLAASLPFSCSLEPPLSSPAWEAYQLLSLAANWFFHFSMFSFSPEMFCNIVICHLAWICCWHFSFFQKVSHIIMTSFATCRVRSTHWYLHLSLGSLPFLAGACNTSHLSKGIKCNFEAEMLFSRDISHFSLLTLLLPETKGRVLPDTIQVWVILKSPFTVPIMIPLLDRRVRGSAVRALSNASRRRKLLIKIEKSKINKSTTSECSLYHVFSSSCFAARFHRER